MNNAIVIYENEQPQEVIDNLCDKLGYERMDATKLGYLQHKPLTWENECTRHKLLDIIGDMALIGKPLKGRIIATRPGHTVNNKIARLMRQDEQLKAEVQTYENNLGFLNAASKKGNSLIDEMNRKVQKLKDEVQLVREKIKAIDAENREKE